MKIEYFIFGTILLLTIINIYKLSRYEKILNAFKAKLFESSSESNNLFRQLECLIGIYIDLKFSSRLPLTRDWAASPDFLWHISKYAMKHKPLVVVECSSGVSTVVLARCMELAGRGHVYSLEHEAEFAEVTRENLATMGLSNWATVIHAPLRDHKIGNEQWPWYSEENLPAGLNIDMLVIDGPIGKLRKNARYPAGQLLFNRLNADSAVFLDDASRPDEQEIVRLWEKEFDWIDTSMLSTEKGCVVLSKREKV